MAVGGVYKNFKFGGVSAKIGFPISAPKYLAASLQIENENTNGFGIGGSVKLSAGDEFTVDNWKTMLIYKQLNINGFIGAEQKVGEIVKVVKEDNGNEKEVLVPTNDICAVGGLMKLYENNKLFAVNGNYNTTRDLTKVEFLFQKRFLDGSFYKIKAGIDGMVSTSREIPVSSGSIVIGATADLHSKTGQLNFNVVTYF